MSTSESQQETAVVLLPDLDAEIIADLKSRTEFDPAEFTVHPTQVNMTDLASRNLAFQHICNQHIDTLREKANRHGARLLRLRHEAATLEECFLMGYLHAEIHYKEFCVGYFLYNPVGIEDRFSPLIQLDSVCIDRNIWTPVLQEAAVKKAIAVISAAFPKVETINVENWIIDLETTSGLIRCGFQPTVMRLVLDLKKPKQKEVSDESLRPEGAADQSDTLSE